MFCDSPVTFIANVDKLHLRNGSTLAVDIYILVHLPNQDTFKLLGVNPEARLTTDYHTSKPCSKASEKYQAFSKCV